MVQSFHQQRYVRTLAVGVVGEGLALWLHSSAAPQPAPGRSICCRLSLTGKGTYQDYGQ
jgi:hypothetical protein